jgi:hypothetical protein
MASSSTDRTKTSDDQSKKPSQTVSESKEVKTKSKTVNHLDVPSSRGIHY